MNNGMKMTMKTLLIVMMPTFCFWSAVWGEKFQKVQYDPRTIEHNRVLDCVLSFLHN